MDGVASNINNQLSARKHQKSRPNDKKRHFAAVRTSLPYCDEETSSYGSDEQEEEIGVVYYAPSFHKKN